ncbi:uncharacterized protein Dsimw501_GD16287, isoform B [Drosophila simulans]|nr:uncharacterized protein Dsimw501_GD16287, isoform B [Drosophila simulans]
MRAKRGAGQKVMMSGSRHNRPAESSRVPPLAREYISAIATDRELDRFMALSSTASSGASGSTHSCALGSVQPPGCASMENESRPESGHRRRTKCSDHPSRERSVSPPPSKHTISQFPSPKSQVTQAKPDEYTIIPIVLASSPSFRSVAVTQTMSQSAEDIRTPTKSPQMQNKKTQTPESVLKSHKRLEWDPAADVGYCKRAMSMSNISTLERSVLEDCGWRQPTEQRPETDLDGVQPHEAEEPSPMLDKPTPPLACSTFVNRSERMKSLNSRMESSLSSNKGDSRKKCKSKSRRQDSEVSSCQTDCRSSSRKESTQGSSEAKDIRGNFSTEGTQCSFNRNDTEIDSIMEEEGSIGSRRKDDLRISSRVQDPQISSRRPSVSSSQRESLSSYRRDDSRLNSPNSSRLGSQVSSRVESSRASSRRESQTTSLYGSSSATSFDYHMHMQQEVEVVKQNQRRQQEKEVEPQEQLEKEQHQNDMQQEEENGKELRDKDHHSETKQQGNQPLTRDQRKAEQRQEKDHQPEREQQRIQKLTRDQRKAEQRQEKDHQPEREQPGVQQLTRDQRKAIQREKEREQERQYTAAQFEKIRSNRRHANKENQQPENPVVNPSTASTSATSLDIGSGSRPRGELDLGIDLLCSLVRSRSLSQGQKKKLVRDIARRISCLELTESSTSLRSLSISSKEQLKVPTGSLQQAAPTSTNHSSSRSSSKAERIALPVPAPRKRTVIGTSSPLPESLSYSGSTSGSGEVITQKTNVPTRAASTDADIEPLNLQDWLNPMTLSEIEFEERLKGGTDSERRRQLHWVKTEIHRMQGFKNLLESISLPSKSHKEPNTESEPSVDQFQSAATAAQIPSSMRCMGDQKERPDKEYHLQQGMAAEAVKEMENSGTATTPAPPVRIESVGVNLTNSDPSTLPAPPPTQPPPLPPHLYQQNLQNRKKMATPLLASSRSTSGGARSESVCSFVQQRQRQFREHYQNQQQQQFVLLQQQKLYQLQKQLNQQRDILTQRQQHCGQCAQCGHQRTCVHQQHCPKFQRHPQEAQDQHDEREQYMQMQYAQAAGSAYATPLQSGNSGADKNEAIYYQVVNSQGVASYVQATMVSTGTQNEASATGGAEGSAITRSTTTTTNSLSSMMCISSDMSVPMGLMNTCETTTTTTTHQYDDVACQRVRRGHKETRMNAESMQRQTLQVRPRAISYVIQFTPTGSSEVLGEMPSLQDQLQLARPEFCANAKQRKAILNEMQMIRNVRRQELDNVLNQSPSMEALNRHLDQLPPPAISRVRLFTTREMKAITSKRCKNLPEVLAAQSRQQEERRRRSNRLMRDVFNKSLKSRVASGKISLNHSVAII